MNLFQRKSEPQEAPPPDADERGTPPVETAIEVVSFGFLVKQPEERLDRRESPYVTAQLAVDASRGVYLALVCYSPEVNDKLTRMDVGDGLSVRGPLILFRDGEGTSLGVNVKRIFTHRAKSMTTVKGDSND